MNWYSSILSDFTPQVAPLTLVADPDNLLTEAGILQAIKERGFEILHFEDAISFRYVYEFQYRYISKTIDLVIVVNAEEQELCKLPYDLLKTARQLTFSINSLFPNLSYTIVNALDRSYFDLLYQAQTQYKPQQLGDNATSNFILRHVFDTDPDSIKQTSDLLLMLLRRHYRAPSIPTILDEYLLQKLQQQRLLSKIPLSKIVSNRQAFFEFIQNKWFEFISQKLNKSNSATESGGTYAPSDNLSFDNKDIQLYINNLFTEGYLQPIKAEELKITTGQLELNPWIAASVYIDPKAEQNRRLQSLLELTITENNARYQDWLKFAQTWAELIVLWHEEKAPNLEEQFLALQEQVDGAFLNWVDSRYGTLYNQVGNTPVMLHQIPRYIERYLEASTTNKVALVVLDGLAFDQWLVLRKVLLKQQTKLKFNTEAVFAWLPTITSVSRQAIFAGKPPVYFPNSLDTTAKEESLWKQYWTERGFNPLSVAYLKGLGKTNTASLVETKLSPKIKVIGLVVDIVDEIMHGMQLGTAGMHNQVRQWAELGIMSNLLDLLLQNNFQVFLTSDHGNIEATGMGQPKEGATADVRGERVRVYPDKLLRSLVKNEFATAIEWQFGLPPQYLPLLAPRRQAFIRQGEKIVAHGSTCVEELIVPFISIYK